MRIKVTLIFLVVFGIGLVANLLTDNRKTDPSQLEKVRTVCLQCHPEVPKYDTVWSMHAKMASFNCSRCHTDNSALRATDSVHSGLQWLSIGAVLFTLTGITVNYSVINRRGKVN